MGLPEGEDQSLLLLLLLEVGVVGLKVVVQQQDDILDCYVLESLVQVDHPVVYSPPHLSFLPLVMSVVTLYTLFGFIILSVLVAEVEGLVAEERFPPHLVLPLLQIVQYNPMVLLLFLMLGTALLPEKPLQQPDLILPTDPVLLLLA